jgi:hypothetical protein
VENVVGEMDSLWTAFSRLDEDGIVVPRRLDFGLAIDNDLITPCVIDNVTLDNPALSVEILIGWEI